MRKSLSFLIFLWPLFLFSVDFPEIQNVAATEGLPSSIVNQSVCAISGEYRDSVIDVVIPGPEPLIIRRTYESQAFEGNVGSCWSFNHRERLILATSNYGGSVYVIRLKQPTGAQLDYIFPTSKDSKSQKPMKFDLIVPKGLTNGAGDVGGKTNIKNQQVYYHPSDNTVTSITGAGNHRSYVKTGWSKDGWNVLGLKTEEKVNGSIYRYDCDNEKMFGLANTSCESKKTGQVFGSVNFKELTKEKYHRILELSTSDGKSLKYYFRTYTNKTKTHTQIKRSSHIDINYLTKVEHPYAPTEHYEYEKRKLRSGLQIVCKSRPESRFVKIDYYHMGLNGVGGPVGNISIKKDDDYRLDRVKKQQAPVGTDDSPITTHRYVYDCNVKHPKDKPKELLDGTTDVYDAYDHKVSYAYDKKHLLTSITRFRGVSDYTPYVKESFIWGTDSQEGNLLAKIVKDEQSIHHASCYAYDSQGNVLSHALYGSLTGMPTKVVLDSHHLPIEGECDKKTYTYSDDGLNLVLSEIDSNGKTTLFEYVKKTDHLKSKLIVYDGKIQLREFYFYDDNYVLIKKASDNGSAHSYGDLSDVTQRHYTSIIPRQTAPFGLPERLEETYYDFDAGHDKLLKAENFHYSPDGHLLKKDVFDANNQFAYSLTWEYDEHGNLTRETNALGEATIKKYDANDNLIFEQGPSDFYMQNTYDFANRLISQEEIHTNGDRFVTNYAYDYRGNCISTINPFGHETRQTFDEFNRIVKIEYPPITDEEGQVVHPVVKRTFDISGYPVIITDPKGRETKTEFNIRGKPIKIVYPDHTTEQFLYRLDGDLLSKIEKNGTRVVYTRDPLGRVTEESTYSQEGQLLKKIQHSYKGIHLVQTIDPEGCLIKYYYDFAGRLAWKFHGNRVEQHFYDALGRESEVRESYGDQPHEFRSTIKICDLLNRVIEERLQDSNGTIIHCAKFAYDKQGNRILEQKGELKTFKEYDAHNNIVKIINGVGEVTHTVYQTNHINAYGQRVLKTITTDPLGYQIHDIYDSANRLVETRRCNPLGITVSHQEILYDLCGNQCRVIDEVIQQGTSLRKIDTLYTYSDDNQVTAIIEAAWTSEQKITKTLYNDVGQKSAIIKPDGIQLFYEYDPLGRVKTLKSSDNTISYHYEYNQRDQLTRIEDLVLKFVAERKYDPIGELIKETLGNGLSLQFTYDKTGRVRTIELPDQSNIEYVYNAVDLKEIHRNIEGKRIYSHLDLSHNLAGLITKIKLPGDNGEIDYSYNGIGRCTSILTPAFHQHIPEKGFDAAGNLLCYHAQDIPYHFTYDDHYQIESEKGHVNHTYLFDSLSNRIKKDDELHTHNALNQILAKGNEQFIYDPNGNLIRRINEQTIQYTYDALDRLTSVTQNGQTTNYFYDSFNRRLIKRQGSTDQLFIYQGQEEIGIWEKGKCIQLRILGKNQRNPMVALEINGTPYVPIHDISGNVVRLLNLQGQVIEQYRYTVFGESQILSASGEEIPRSSIGNAYQYASKYFDEESGLVAFGIRYYDPALGRWITPDPAGYADGSNLYCYVHNSPLLYYDEFGLYLDCGLVNIGTFPLQCAYNGISKTVNAVQEVKQWIFGEPEVHHVFVENQYENEYNLRVSQNPTQSIAPFERTTTYGIKNGELYQPTAGNFFNLKDSSKGTCFVCGIGNTLEDFKESMKYLESFSIDNLIGVHCASYGFARDAKSYINSLVKNYAYEGVRELQMVCWEFFRNVPADAIFHIICHSRGVVFVRNALMDMPKHIRERIEVIAISPGAFISSNLCKSVIHYESSGDPVPYIDLGGRERCRHSIITLNPHINAFKYFDHKFTSLTFMRPIKTKLEDYYFR